MIALRKAVASACLLFASVKATSEPTLDIAQTAVATADLSTLVTALTSADLVTAVSDTGSGDKLTVFAPRNAAFEALDLGVLKTLLLPVNNDLLTSVLTYHVAAGEALASSLSFNQQIPTLLQGENLTVTGSDEVMINNANLVDFDIMATNGVVHIIDSVLIPAITIPNKNIVETANGTSSLSTLTAAVVAAGLGDALMGSDLTVFAPTDDAFAALGSDTVAKLLMTENLPILASILQYHVAGSKIMSTDLGTEVSTLNGTFMVSDLMVNGTDYLAAGNSVIHIINNVLIPSWFSMDLLTTTTTTAAPTLDIAQTAVATADLSTLVTALTSADLVTAVSDTGSGDKLTVFAPLNSAFDALDLGVLKTLLLPVNKDLLTSVLTYHVASGEALSSSLSLNQEIPTLQTGVVTVTSVSPVTINNAGVVTADVPATNGVVHIIDSVLIPAVTIPNKNIVETANGTSSLSTLTAAVVAAGLGDALMGSDLTVFAPTDDAFAALGSDTVAKLLMTENLPILASILQYHVAGSKIMSTGLGTEVSTLNGTFMVSDLMVNGTDYLAAGNSVIHIINNVLIPSWFSMDLLTTTTTSAEVEPEASAASLPVGAPLCRLLALFFAMWSMFH